jgi:hypothetical protein
MRALLVGRLVVLRFGSALQELGQNPEAHLIASHGTFSYLLLSCAALCGKLFLMVMVVVTVRNANLHPCLASIDYVLSRGPCVVLACACAHTSGNK